MEDTGFHVPKDKMDRFAANYAPLPDGMMLMDDPEKVDIKHLLNLSLVVEA